MDAHEKAVMQNAVGDVADGRVMVFPITSTREISSLRLFSMGVVAEKDKISI